MGVDVMVIERLMFSGLETAKCKHRLTLQPSLTSPAYCLFTSGSTGKPKGVVIEHQALTASLQAHGRAIGLNSRSRSLQNTSYTFDVSITEIFGTLLLGGCVCIPEDAERLHDTVAYMNRMRVNWAFFTPSFAQILDAREIPALETVVFGGESPTVACIEQWKAPRRRLIDAYGPTECTIFSMTGDIDFNRRSVTNIGRPVGGMALIVDENDPSKLMPIGAIGELLIAGAIVARGYLGDAEKTAASFIEPPQWSQRLLLAPIKKMYKTGDLVRYCDDGTVEYLGRKDRQVKVNGQRLELGEVERAIDAYCPSVTAIVDVITPDFQLNHLILVAFVAFDNISERDNVSILSADEYQSRIDGIRSNLLAVLPFYMIPSHFIPLSHIPLSAAGKPDHYQLKMLAGAVLNQEHTTRVTEERSFSEMEDRIRRAWSEVLGIPYNQLRLDDSFISYGDSLTAIRLIRSLRADNLTLRMIEIFQNPTISRMATVARQLSTTSGVQLSSPFSLIPAGTHKNLVVDAAEQCCVGEDAIKDIYPCTPMQEAFIAMTAHHPNAYLGRLVYHLPEQVDVQRFRESWRLVIQSTAALRTRVIASPQSLMQVVLDIEPAWVEGTDLNEYLEHESLPSIALGKPLTKFGLVLEAGEPRSIFFVWTIHHALYDGHSLPIILDDVRRAYFDMPQIHRSPFRDFVGQLASGLPDHEESFWRLNLEGFTTQSFPHTHSAEYCPIADSVTSFQSTCHNPSAKFPRSVQLQAAWAFLFSRYVESNDVVFGVTLNGRSGPITAIDDIVGPTLNTLPLRVSINREQSVHTFMLEIQSCIAQILDFEALSLQQIRQLSSSAALACDFQTILVVQPPSLDLNDLLFKDDSLVLSDELIVGRSLTVEAQLIKDGGVNLRAHFDSSVVTTQQVDRMLQQWDFILHQLTDADLDRPIGSIYELSDQDRLRMVQWNSGAPQAQNTTLHDLVGRWELQTPLKPALYGWDASFTYSELSSTSDRLALRLRTLGVSDGDLVPLCTDKSSCAIVCMISLLKLGAAFVPLDVRSPPKRLARIVSQTRARLILTSAQYRHVWVDSRHVVIDRDLFDDHSSTTEGTILSPVSPNNVAYVIFTSGSSGIPKGVMIQHYAICTSLVNSAKTLGLHDLDRTLQFASYSFDASILEIFGTLLAGGTVCTPSKKECLDSLQQAVRKYEPTWAILTPSVVQVLSPTDSRSLKTLVLGGEPITSAAIAEWKDNVQLINAYGPTECSILCAAHRVKGLQDAGVIGHPLGSLHWLVDPVDYQKLVPLGTVGELLIEGPIIAQGYLNDPGRTTATFIKTPHWRQDIAVAPQSSRIYLTGDLVRWNENGSLSYLGRKDHQVKVRGQRLEIEEIESKIVHDKLDQRAIVQPKSGPLAKKLVALFTLCNCPGEGEAESEEIQLYLCEEAAEVISQLKSMLSRELPEYMMPDIWIPVLRMPLSSAAKMNRKHIVSWIGGISETVRNQINGFNEGSHSVPHGHTSTLTPTEEILRIVWSELLNVPASHIHGRTSFLHIGGDSVSAMQLVAQCRNKGLSLSVRDVLKCKTLSMVAQKVQSTVQITPRRDLVTTAQPFLLSPIQQMFFEKLTTEHIPVFSQSFLLRIRSHIESEKLIGAIQTIVTRHHMLRARFNKNGAGKWSQYISGDLESSYSINLHQAPVGKPIIPILTKACRAKLNPSKGPVIAFELFRCTGQSYMFLAAHHLVIDLVSWRIIFNDLELLLRSMDLSPNFSLSFPEWCLEQAKWSSANLEPDRALVSPLPPPQYDYWGMSDETNTYEMARICSADLSPALSSEILALCGNKGRLEVLDILIAALAIAFSRVFPDRELPPIFLEHHGREPWLADIDITQTVGWFTTLLPVYDMALGSGNHTDIVDILRHARDCRRRVPANGLEFFSSGFFHPQGRDAFNKSLPPEVMLNFEGFFQQLERFDGIFELSPEADGELADMSPDAPRLALLEFSVRIQNGRMGLSCVYNRKMRHTDRVEQCIREYAEVLRELPELLSASPPIYSLSDFPRAPLDYHDLNKLCRPAIENGIEDIYPILPIQRLMLTKHAQHPMLYVPRLVFRVKSRRSTVCPADICRAWGYTVQHHPVLRTIFVNDAKGHANVQVVLTELEPTILQVEGTKGLLPIHPQACTWPQDKAPHRLTIYSQPGEDLMLLLEVSHALVDMATMTILLQDLAKGIQNGFTDNASLGIGYGDLIDHVFASPAEARSTAFWRDRISSRPDSVVASQYSTTQQHGALSSCVVPIGDDTTFGSLRQALKKREISLPSVLCLAWARVIQCHLGVDEVTFGFVLNGRDLDIPRVDEIAGPLLNFMPYCVRLDRSPEDASSTEALLKSLDNGYIESLAHQCHASTVPMQSFDTIVNFRKHGSNKSLMVSEENICLEVVGSVDPYHHSVVLEVDDFDNELDIRLTFWDGLVPSNVAAEYASTLAGQIRSISCWLLGSAV